MTDILELIKPLVLCINLVGSRITCNPPPIDTDQDYLVFVTNSNLNKLYAVLAQNGYICGGSRPNNLEDDEFVSYKNVAGDINYIITTSKAYHSRFMAATSVAKRFNLLKKDDRIALFEAVLYGRTCEPVTLVEEQKPIDYLSITKQICG